MITTSEQAVKVQHRRIAAGKKGRAKAVRRWFKRTYGTAVEIGTHAPRGLRTALAGDFTQCGQFERTP